MTMKMKPPTPFSKTTFATLVAVAMFAASLSSPLRADLSDYAKINVSDIEDVTLDVSYGVLYFHANGKNYSYSHPTVGNPINLAEFVELLGEAQALLVKEANPRAIVDYYDRQKAVRLRTILLKFGKAQNLRD